MANMFTITRVEGVGGDVDNEMQTGLRWRKEREREYRTGKNVQRKLLRCQFDCILGKFTAVA